MAKIICLANSRKNQNRYIAGMTSEGKWIRPVSGLADGAIPWRMRQIGGGEPTLLDILSVPLDASGPDFGHQSENLLVLKGDWARTGTVKASEILRLCENRDVLLHTDSDRVPEQLISNMSRSERYSLQLIRVTDAMFYRKTSIKGKPQFRAKFTYASNKYDIIITDPIAEDRMSKREKFNRSYILTVSMGGPYEGNYFKFIAAIIEA